MLLSQNPGWLCRLIAAALVSLLSSGVVQADEATHLPPPAARPVDFAKDIQPIFEAKCVKCHGAEKQKGGYRLDVKSIALTGGENHAPNIIPAKSAESPLIQFIAGLDEDMTMPPKGERLSGEQIGLLRTWIDNGAEWPESASAETGDPLEWWSLKPITKPALPVESAHPIDSFISAKLTEKGLAQSPPADARTLCRRLYFDLTGLPPTPEEMDDFLGDRAPDAYERLVERLLASPRYGERWARHWLDVVHYGDTHGYDKDQPRPNAWPYRDYVIRALNEDKPYARFVQEQIAGDALFPGTRDGIEALGFIAAGPWDYIGHVEVSEQKEDGKTARHLDRDDMVGNAIGALSSATVQCAQCHNHKFDPFSQEDYYSLQAVFSALDRSDKTFDLDPVLAKKRQELLAQKQKLEAAEKTFATKIKTAGGKELEELEKQLKAAETAVPQGPRPEYGWHSRIETNAETRKWVQVDLGASLPLSRVVLAGVWDDFHNIGAGFGFPVRFRIEGSDDPTFAGTPMVIAAHDLEDFQNPGTAPQSFPCEGKSARYIRITANKLAPRARDFIFALAELQVFDMTGKNVALGAPVASLDSIETDLRWNRKNLTDDIYPAKTGGGVSLATLREQRDAILARIVDEPT
ncbi:MAG TPA: DUF1549 domain-containing protein, partial [Chthoniobacteraceae bacterium]